MANTPNEWMNTLGKNQAAGAGNVMSAFQPIYNMFGSTQSGSGGGSQPTSGGTQLTNNLFGGNLSGGAGVGQQGGGANPFGLAPQSVAGGDNSLTQFFRSLSNLLGTGGAGILQGGESLINSGMNMVQGAMPTVGQGVGMQGTGFGTTQQALNTMAPALSYYNNILSQDPNALAAAVGPQATSLAGQSANLLNQVQQGVPRGGYAATQAANIPQMQAQTVGQFLLGQRPGAANALQAAGPQISGIGAQQAGIGQGVSQTGLGVGNLGLGVGNLGGNLTQQGLSALASDIQAMLQKQNLNQQVGPLQDFLGITQGIGNLVGAAATYAGSSLPGGSGCWIAEAIYGVDDIRTHLARAYLNGPFKQTRIGRLVMALYLKFGRRVAAQVRKRRWLQRLLKPLFDRAWKKATPWTLISFLKLHLA